MSGKPAGLACRLQGQSRLALQVLGQSSRVEAMRSLQCLSPQVPWCRRLRLAREVCARTRAQEQPDERRRCSAGCGGRCQRLEVPYPKGDAPLLSPACCHAAVDAPCGFVFQNPDHQVVMPTVAADVAFGLGRWAGAAAHASCKRKLPSTICLEWPRVCDWVKGWVGWRVGWGGASRLVRRRVVLLQTPAATWRPAIPSLAPGTGCPLTPCTLWCITPWPRWAVRQPACPPQFDSQSVGRTRSVCAVSL